MVCTFDIETLGWDYPLAVGFYDGNEHYWDFLRKGEEDDVIWRFLLWLKDHFTGAVIYGHYARNFDNKFLLDSLISHQQTAGIQIGLGILKWEEAKIRFIDSNLLLKLSLEKACKAFGVEQKLNWNHNRTRVLWKMGQKDIYAFRAYLERDCRSLSAVYGRFVWELIDRFGINEPASTLATTALKIFEAIQELEGGYSLEEIESNSRVHGYIRQSLYGGRNEVYGRYGEGVHLYDIRSMYVSCYNTPVPIGRMEWVGRPKIERGSIAEAEVEVPKDWFIGPLPYHKNGLLLFPVGKFKGWWDMVELRYAEELGCKVRLTRQLEAEERPVLKKFGESLLKLRYTSTPELGILWKVLGIQLIGKLAQSRNRTVVVHRSKIQDFDGWEPIDRGYTYFEGSMPSNGRQRKHLDKMVKPALTSRIRAEARVRHHRRLMDSLEKGGDLYYCDTDSVYTSTQMETGKNPGDLQLVDEASRLYVIMRKFYGYVTPQGIIHQRSSGFSGFKLSEEEFKRILEGGEIVKQNGRPTLTGVGEILRQRDKLEAQFIPRTIKTPQTQQNREIDGKITRPIVLG